jgi:translation initiation factor eIF-2B subunit gamma
LVVAQSSKSPSLAPLTNDDGNEACPKALLPVANRPMIDYPLAWLDQSGVHGEFHCRAVLVFAHSKTLDVLLVCPSAHLPAISHHINSDSTSSSFSSLRIDLQSLDDNKEVGLGTAAVLKHFANRIKHDFVLLPCDFIPPPSLSLGRILNKFRSDVGAEGAVATSCWFEHSSDKGSFEDSDGKAVAPPIVWDPQSETLLYVSSHDEVESGSDELELRMSLLSR